MADTDQTLLRNALRTVLLRDLDALDREIAAYPDDESVWLTPPGILNSGGNLALHLIGNIRHFFGGTLAKNGYVRNRDAEFGTKGLSRGEIREQIRQATAELDAALDVITDDQLSSVFPLPIRDFRVGTATFLVHLAVHFGYHLGQVDYHRRLSTSNPPSANAMAMEPLKIDV